VKPSDPLLLAFDKEVLVTFLGVTVDPSSCWPRLILLFIEFTAEQSAEIEAKYYKKIDQDLCQLGGYSKMSCSS
jgi:hypothetical protein